jgi:hypothetical protein
MAGNTEHERRPVGYDLSDPSNRHEHADVDVRSIGKFGIALTLLCIVTFGIILGVFRFLQTRTDALQPAPPALPADARRLPPEPRLQETPLPDLRAMREAEEKLLNGYAWIDQPKGIARIPVHQAIDMLAARGLPSRPVAPAANPAAAVTVPTNSSLGPKLQAPGGPLAPAPPAVEKQH